MQIAALRSFGMKACGLFRTAARGLTTFLVCHAGRQEDALPSVVPDPPSALKPSRSLRVGLDDRHLRAPSYDCSSIAYFKMAKETAGRAKASCFPGNYQLGLDVLIIVRDQKPDKPSPAG